MEAVTFWIGILIGAGATIVAYVAVIRPWHMTWGTTPDERHRTLPGDELVQRPLVQATHAISIAAPIEQIWPWLVQIGQGRGGFYSYDWLENIFGCDIHNANEIVPAWQQLKAGEGIRLHPKSPPLSVAVAELNHAIILAGGRDLIPDVPIDRSFLRLHSYRAFTWAFILEERTDKSTRFLVRVRVAWDRGFVQFCRNRLFLEPAHSIMQRKMNLGLKRRAEALRNR